MRILLFAGAGTSIELGVPGMAGLATSFLRHVRQWNVQPEIAEKLMGYERDLEIFIERVDRVCEAREPLGALEVDMSESGQKVAAVRREVEWFVQHVAERVTPRLAHLMWGSVLRCAIANEIVFVTTNYDRAIEVAASIDGISLDGGFGEGNEGETTRWRGFSRSDNTVQLVKLHGSTDWYRDIPTGRAIRLRHPMPLFGDGTLVFRERELGAALVLPSREKILTKQPYPWLSHEFLSAGDRSAIVLFVGSSLRDPHIRQAAEAWAERKPVFIVTPDVGIEGVTGANTIHETASEFLVSTLPNALSSDDPTQLLRNRCRDGENNDLQMRESSGILGVLGAALGQGVDSRERCEAVSYLVDRRVTLPVQWVEKLIKGDDPVLARHALGLIVGSSGHAELVRTAKECQHMGDRAFPDEYGMLREVMRSG